MANINLNQELRVGKTPMNFYAVIRDPETNAIIEKVLIWKASAHETVNLGVEVRGIDAHVDVGRSKL